MAQYFIWGNNGAGQASNNDTTAFTTSTFWRNTNNYKLVSYGNPLVACIKNDNTLWLAGQNYTGSLGNNTTSSASSFVQTSVGGTWNYVAAGGQVIAIKSDGTLWGWGTNYYGQVGNGNSGLGAEVLTPVQINASTNWASTYSMYYGSAAINSLGQLYFWGTDSTGWNGGFGTFNLTPTQGPTNKSWSQVAMSTYGTTIALATDGGIWTWGQNADGNCGRGSTGGSNIPPGQIGTATNYAKVVAGFTHMLALKKDGTLWAWGYNGYGQLGQNNTINRNSPTQISGTWLDAAAGPDATWAIKNDGTVWACGGNAYGQQPYTGSRSSLTQIGSISSYKSFANILSTAYGAIVEVVPTATVTPSPSPTPSPTVSPSPTPSPSPSPSVTNSPTPSPTLSPSPTPSATASPSPTPTFSPSPTPSPTPSPSISPTVTASPTPSPSNSPAVTASPTPSPTLSPSPSPSVSPNPTQTPLPTNMPSQSPTMSPSPTPSPTPSPSPTPTPTDSPMPTAMPIPSLSPTATPAPTSSGYYYYLLIDCARTYNKVGRTTKTPAQIVATPNWFVGPNLCFVVVGYATGPAYDYDLDASTSAPINGCTDPLCNPPAITPTASTNFVTNSLLPNADGYDYYNQGTGSGSLSLTFQNSSSSAQAIFVSLFNQSTQTMLLSVNGVNYPIYAGQSFSQTITLKAGNFITIASLMPFLYASSTVFGQIYVARPSQCAYIANLTPATRAVEGDEGSLDTSVVNGVSQQRNAYITIIENGDQVKVIETSIDDDNCFNTNIQGLPDVIPLICSGYPQF
jgi:alpha-tubulin suppressor-like RCC1 family protein